jgi:hypothetical protein
MAMSPSSRNLDACLTEGGPVAEAIKGSDIHRTRLHAYRTGKSKPDADTIAKLHRLSGGRVAADGWEDEAEAPEGSVATGTEGHR